MNLNKFVRKYNLKSVDVDGYYGAQCWDLVAEYSRHVVGVPGKNYPYGLPTGNGCACGVYGLFKDPLKKYYKKIKYAKGHKPQAGDIVVWNCSLPGGYGCGHIAIVLTASKKSFTSFDQNWGGKYAHKVGHDYWHVVGFLRPKKNIRKKRKKYYKVRPGDYLIRIAGRFGITYRKLRKLNPNIKQPNKIYPGQKVRVK